MKTQNQNEAQFAERAASIRKHAWVSRRGARGATRPTSAVPYEDFTNMKSNGFQSIPITFKKINLPQMDAEGEKLKLECEKRPMKTKGLSQIKPPMNLRWPIYDLPTALWRGNQRDGHASKCPLRGQTKSQRDIVHHPGAKGCLLTPITINSDDFRRFPEISGDFLKIIYETQATWRPWRLGGSVSS